MAKIYKISAYIVDPNDKYKNGEECFADLIDNTEVYTPVPIKHKSKSFNWKDTLNINAVGCKIEDCEKYFE